MSAEEEPDHQNQDAAGNGSWVLVDLMQSGNHDVTVSESLRFLKEDPEDGLAHFCLVFGYIGQEQLKKAKQHLDYLIQAEPEESNTHLAALGYYSTVEKPRQMRKHAAEGMRIDPENSVFYYYAAVAEAAKLRFDQAKRFLDMALQLDPNDPDCLNLQVRLSSVSDTSAESSWRRVEELRGALQHDPQNAALHYTMGEVYLDELDSPGEAEFHFREALKSSPGDRDYQRSLFNAVGHRDLLYRLLSIPSRTFSWLGNLWYGLMQRPWYLIFFVFGFKFVAAFFAWLIFVTLLFWPAGKVYEWLLVSEIRSGARSSVGKLRLWSMFQRWPRWMRFGLFLLVSGGLYAGIFLWADISLTVGFTVIAVGWIVHAGIVIGIWYDKRARRLAGKRRREKRRGPPPLPHQN